MESLQPYNYGASYKVTNLWRLNKLWNIDKHRHITFHSAALNAEFPNIPQSARSFITFEEINGGHTMRLPLSLVKENVNFEPRTDMQIYFGDEAEGITITSDDFLQMYQFVRDAVFPRFQGFFP